MRPPWPAENPDANGAGVGAGAAGGLRRAAASLTRYSLRDIPGGTCSVPAPVKMPENPDHQLPQNNDPGFMPVTSGMLDYFRMRRILAIHRFAAADPLTKRAPFLALRFFEVLADIELAVRLLERRVRRVLDERADALERLPLIRPTPRDI